MIVSTNISINALLRNRKRPSAGRLILCTKFGAIMPVSNYHCRDTFVNTISINYQLTAISINCIIYHYCNCTLRLFPISPQPATPFTYLPIYPSTSSTSSFGRNLALARRVVSFRLIYIKYNDRNMHVKKKGGKRKTRAAVTDNESAVLHSTAFPTLSNARLRQRALLNRDWIYLARVTRDRADRDELSYSGRCRLWPLRDPQIESTLTAFRSDPG